MEKDRLEYIALAGLQDTIFSEEDFIQVKETISIDNCSDIFVKEVLVRYNCFYIFFKIILNENTEHNTPMVSIIEDNKRNKYVVNKFFKKENLLIFKGIPALDNQVTALNLHFSFLNSQLFPDENLINKLNSTIETSKNKGYSAESIDKLIEQILINQEYSAQNNIFGPNKDIVKTICLKQCERKENKKTNIKTVKINKKQIISGREFFIIGLQVSPEYFVLKIKAPLFGERPLFFYQEKNGAVTVANVSVNKTFFNSIMNLSFDVCLDCNMHESDLLDKIKIINFETISSGKNPFET